jgi:hypothetical protein
MIRSLHCIARQRKTKYKEHSSHHPLLTNRRPREASTDKYSSKDLTIMREIRNQGLEKEALNLLKYIVRLDIFWTNWPR